MREMMRSIFTALILMVHTFRLCAQSTDGSQIRTEHLSDLLDEAMVRNPEIIAAVHEMGRAAAVIPQQNAVEDPILFYEREEMPGFQWNNPMMHRIGLMQTLRFPTKLGRSGDLAEIDAEHAHHDHLEKVNEVVFRVKSAYFDLWYVQQAMMLTIETSALLSQFTEAARTRYSTGQGGQQDLLKAMVELGKADARLVELRQEELSAKAMLMSLTNRLYPDTLGNATLDADPGFDVSLDLVQNIALRNRPMLIHDSLTVQEKETMVALAQDEYLPDLLFGIEYIKWPDTRLDAWTVRAGVSLPFAPWTLGKASGRVEEAEADLSKSQSSLVASQNMVLALVRDSFLKAQSAWRRLSLYDQSLLPQSLQAFESTLISYQTGKEDFLMLIDSYRTLVELSGESLELRRDFEKNVAELEFAAGVDDVMAVHGERNQE